MTKNPYTVLGISPSATAEEIKSAYRKKAKENHPDLHPNDPNATERMNEINEAYSILTDPQKLAAYKAEQEAEAYRSNPYSGSTYGSAYGNGSSAPYGSYSNPYGSTQNRQTYYYWYSPNKSSEESGHTEYRTPSLFGRVLKTVAVFVVLRFLFRMLFGGGIMFLPFFFF